MTWKADPPGGPQTVQVRHDDIHDDNMGLERFRTCNRFSSNLSHLGDQ